MKQTLLLLLVGLVSSVAFSGVEVTVLEPTQYVRESGAPTVYSSEFTGVPGDGHLLLVNGSGGDDAVDCSDLISSAKIWVNGVLVFGPGDFNQQVSQLETDVPLGEQNTITVELRSTPGSYITITITQTVTGLIAFADQGDIFVMNEDGSNVTQLTFDPAIDSYPAISPDGQTVAFSTAGEGEWEVYAVDVDGFNLRPLTVDLDSPIKIKGIDWHPDGSKLLISTRRDDPERVWKLYEVAADGSGWALLFDNTDGLESQEPSYNFEGSRIFMQRNTPFNGYTTELWSSDPSGGDLTKLTNTANGTSSALTNRQPAFMKLGGEESIVLSRVIGSPAERQVWVMDTDGGNLRNPCPSGTYDSLPASSPGAPNKIVFVRQAEGYPPEIWTMDLSNCEASRIGGVSGSLPDWWVAVEP